MLFFFLKQRNTIIVSTLAITQEMKTMKINNNYIVVMPYKIRMSNIKKCMAIDKEN